MRFPLIIQRPTKRPDPRGHTGAKEERANAVEPRHRGAQHHNTGNTGCRPPFGAAGAWHTQHARTATAREQKQLDSRSTLGEAR
eukprot:4302945-Prymnesium_polylepis.1